MPEDKQVWAFDPKDLFSMKSACWGAVELSRSECSGSYSDVSHEIKKVLEASVEPPSAS